ncbi:hypothetical protein PR048_017017 [Dryococelus australis]|uniref:Uncharacterized protein n=1 Tax=Dryococelus australis TaxID=614101 RepID=A0ABQ9H8B8_9NEOP|nr:hypothetical protein PR048_017017 [Dryococelus australis]
MEQHRNAKSGVTGDPRANPLTSGIIRRDSSLRKPGRGLNPVRLGGRQAAKKRLNSAAPAALLCRNEFIRNIQYYTVCEWERLEGMNHCLDVSIKDVKEENTPGESPFYCWDMIGRIDPGRRLSYEPWLLSSVSATHPPGVFCVIGVRVNQAGVDDLCSAQLKATTWRREFGKRTPGCSRALIGSHERRSAETFTTPLIPASLTWREGGECLRAEGRRELAAAWPGPSCESSLRGCLQSKWKRRRDWVRACADLLAVDEPGEVGGRVGGPGRAVGAYLLTQGILQLLHLQDGVLVGELCNHDTPALSRIYNSPSRPSVRPSVRLPAERFTTELRTLVDMNSARERGLERSREIREALNILVVRANEGRNARAGETEDPQENPPTSGIVWHNSHMRKTRGQPRPESNPIRLGYVKGEERWLTDYSALCTTASRANEGEWKDTQTPRLTWRKSRVQLSVVTCDDHEGGAYLRVEGRSIGAYFALVEARLVPLQSPQRHLTGVRQVDLQHTALRSSTTYYSQFEVYAYVFDHRILEYGYGSVRHIVRRHSQGGHAYMSMTNPKQSSSASSILANPKQSSSPILLHLLRNQLHNQLHIFRNLLRTKYRMLHTNPNNPSHQSSARILNNPLHESATILSTNLQQSSAPILNSHPHQSSAPLHTNSQQYLSLILTNPHQCFTIFTNPSQSSPILQSITIPRDRNRFEQVNAKRGSKQIILADGVWGGGGGEWVDIPACCWQAKTVPPPPTFTQSRPTPSSSLRTFPLTGGLPRGILSFPTLALPLYHNIISPSTAFKIPLLRDDLNISTKSAKAITATTQCPKISSCRSPPLQYSFKDLNAREFHYGPSLTLWPGADSISNGAGRGIPLSTCGRAEHLSWSSRNRGMLRSAGSTFPENPSPRGHAHWSSDEIFRRTRGSKPGRKHSPDLPPPPPTSSFRDVLLKPRRGFPHTRFVVGLARHVRIHSRISKITFREPGTNDVPSDRRTDTDWCQVRLVSSIPTLEDSPGPSLTSAGPCWAAAQAKRSRVASRHGLWRSQLARVPANPEQNTHIKVNNLVTSVTRSNPLSYPRAVVCGFGRRGVSLELYQVSSGSTLLVRIIATKATRIQYPVGSPLVSGFSRGSTVSPALYSGATPYALQAPSSALKTSLLRAAQISSITPLTFNTILYYTGNQGWQTKADKNPPTQLAYSLEEGSLIGDENQGILLARHGVRNVQVPVSTDRSLREYTRAWFTCTPITPNRQDGILEHPTSSRPRFPREPRGNRGRLLIGYNSFPFRMFRMLGVIGVHFQKLSPKGTFQSIGRIWGDRFRGQSSGGHFDFIGYAKSVHRIPSPESELTIHHIGYPSRKHRRREDFCLGYAVKAEKTHTPRISLNCVELSKAPLPLPSPPPNLPKTNVCHAGKHFPVPLGGVKEAARARGQIKNLVHRVSAPPPPLNPQVRTHFLPQGWNSPQRNPPRHFARGKSHSASDCAGPYRLPYGYKKFILAKALEMKDRGLNNEVLSADEGEMR